MKNTFTDPLIVNIWFTTHHIKALIMRVSQVSVLIMTSAMLTMAGPKGNGQSIENTIVELGFENESLKGVFREIERQTDFLFSWDASIEKIFPRVSLEEGRYTVKELLEIAMNGTKLTYSQSRNYVIVLPAEKSGRGVQKVAVEKANQLATPSSVLITGTVRDASTQEPLAGVNIIVKGTAKGTTTDADGKYALDVEGNDLLVFTFVGYKSFETHTSGKSVIDVEMQEDVASLKEVIVNGGYFQITKDRATMNTSKVNAKDIENQPITTPLMALQGRVPGLDVTPINGAPGGAATIQIRGQNSLRRDGALPLYIIDGVPVDATPIRSNGRAFFYVGFDPLSTLNPSNIESVEVLKDAAATAIYGSRGSNGVILVTTKHGKAGQTNLNINYYTGAGKLPQKIDLLNTQEYLEMRREALANDGQLASLEGPFAWFFYPDLAAWDSTRYTDWQDVLLGNTSKINDLQLNFSGGNNNTTFRFGGEYYKESTIFPGDFGFRRYNGNFSFDHVSFNRKFKTSFSVNYGATESDLSEGLDLVQQALNLSPNAPKLRKEDGSLNWETIEFGGTPYHTWINPLSYFENTHNNRTASFVSNCVFGYDIIPGLTAKISSGYTEINQNEYLKQPISANPPRLVSSARGTAISGRNERKTWIIEPQIMWSKNLAGHHLDVVVGGSHQGSNGSYFSIRGSNYTSDVFLNSILLAPTKTVTADNNSEYRYVALYSRIGYDYKNKYLLDLSGRRDGSSRFGPDKQYGNFWAIGAGWIFTQENWFKDNLGFLNFGKIRSSYGVTGNDQLGDYLFLDLYASTPTTYQNTISLLPNNLFNPDLAWEQTKKIEVAAQLRFFEDRISFEVSKYNHRSSNQLNTYPLPATTGFDGISSNLNATIENNGWEFLLDIEILRRKDFVWSLESNLSLPRNELVKFDGIEQSSYYTIYKVGKPLTIQRLFTWKGVNPETGLYEIADINQDGSINEDDKTFLKSLGRNYYGGTLNSLTYKNINFSFLIQFSDLIKYGAGMTVPLTYPGLSLNQPSYVMDRWQKAGDITNVAKYSQTDQASFEYGYVTTSDHAVFNNRFIRLKTLSLTYNLPDKWIKKAYLQNAKVYFQGQNLFVANNYQGFDPETGVGLPPLKIVTMGIQMTL